MLLESSWGALGELLDPPGCLLGGSCSLLGSMMSLRAPLGAPWHAPGELLETSWRDLRDVLEAFGGFSEASGGLLEASWRGLSGPWALLKASWKHLVAVCLIM